jgi:hypothetical protein
LRFTNADNAIMTPVDSFTLDEGTDAYGVKTRLIFQGDEVVKHTSQDVSGILEFAKAKRNHTAGEKWGEMRHVGTIPMHIYAQLLAITNQDERKKALKQYLKANPAFVTFDAYLKK